jgi:hypothetical protein
MAKRRADAPEAKMRIGTTLTPFAGAPYYSEAGESIRVALNQFIRTGNAYDAVIDLTPRRAILRTRSKYSPRTTSVTTCIPTTLATSDGGRRRSFDLDVRTEETPALACFLDG